MATLDVPGHNPTNGDELHVGCWAEHTDGSLIFVAGAENHVVTFEIFDLSAGRVIEFRDRMSEDDFKLRFTSDKSGGLSKFDWRWHDKSPFPWEKVIAAGSQSGTRLASAQDVLDHAADIRAARDRILNADLQDDNKSAAARVADDLGVQGRQLLQDEIQDIIRRRVARPMRRLGREISEAIARRFGP